MPVQSECGRSIGKNGRRYRMKRRSGFTLFMVLFLGWQHAGVAGARAEDFYANKQITLLLGGGAGGGTLNTFARVMANYLTKYIPGSPTFVIQNMPGAGGIRMANYIYNTAPSDGTVVGMGQSTVPILPLTSPNETKYDPNKLVWIGSGTRDVFVGFVWHTAPIKTFEEAKTKPATMGGSAVGSFSIDSAILANEMFGTKFKIVIGYRGSDETQLAVERGEVDGVMATNWGNLVKKSEEWIAQGKIHIVVQYGLEKNKHIPADVPLFIDLAKNEADLQLARFWVSSLEHGKPFFAPPGIPPGRLEILRRAFDATMKDSDFEKELATAGMELDGPMNAARLAQLVKEEMSTPPAVISRMHQLIDKFVKEGHR
jgi:tripartite-type tricarboxylate transporter receptor subunit TctC